MGMFGVIVVFRPFLKLDDMERLIRLDLVAW